MPTFGDWERTVLERTYEHVDFISCHAYYQERGGDIDSYLASSIDMQYVIDTVVATADHVGSKLRSSKKIQLSFDEWNIWYLDEHKESDEVNDEWRYAPRQLEDVYSVVDAVVLGNLLITLLKNHDRVTIDVSELGVSRISEAVTLHDDDVYAKNTLADQNRVGLRPLEGGQIDDGRVRVTLPPVSWSALDLR